MNTELIARLNHYHDGQAFGIETIRDAADALESQQEELELRARLIGYRSRDLASANAELELLREEVKTLEGALQLEEPNSRLIFKLQAQLSAIRQAVAALIMGATFVDETFTAINRNELKELQASLSALNPQSKNLRTVK